VINPQNRKAWIFTKYPILIIPAVMLFFILMLVVGEVLSSLGGKWNIVSSPPAKPIKFIGINDQSLSARVILVIQAEDENLYWIEAQSSDWSLFNPGQFSIDNFRVCDLSTMKFRPWKKPFSTPFVCGEGQGHSDFLLPIPVDLPIYTFVLDQNGKIWLWSGSTNNTFYQCTLPLLASFGLFIGVLLFVKQSRKSKTVSQPRASRPSKPEFSEEYLRKNDPVKIQYWGPKVYQCIDCAKLNHLKDGNYCMACKTRLTDSDVIDNPFI
jgi:hypothetical protein